MKKKQYDIFISYRRDHSVKVEHIYEELNRTFSNIFFDQEEIHTGEIFETKILSALKVSKVLLLILTKEVCAEFNSRENGSDWLVKEILFAHENNIPILPIFLYNEEYAKEINSLINKTLKDCVPHEISFLPLKQFFKIRLERKARKSDIVNLTQEINQEINHKNIIDSILVEKKPDISKEEKPLNWRKLLLIFSIPLISVLLYLGYKNFYQINSLGQTEDPNGLKVITCGKKNKDLNWSGWKEDKLEITKNDKFFYVQIHYYVDDNMLNNIKLGLKKFPFNINANERINIGSFVTADNAQPIIGDMYLQSLSDIELIPEKISFQENKCQSTSCETKLSKYNSKDEKIENLFKRGLSIGDKIENNYGNLIIKFRIKHKERILKKNENSFGVSLKPEGLKSIYGAKKDKNLNWSGWKENEVVINKNDKAIYIEIHYNAYSTGLNNIRLGLKIFPFNIDENEKINISSFVTTDNTQPIIGDIYLQSLSDIELIPERISFQENECKSASCETKLLSYSSEDKKIRELFKRGLNVGDKPKGHYGNLIIKFKIRHKIKTTVKENNKQITTNQNLKDIPTLKVSNKRKSAKRWQKSVHVDSSEILSFQIHYYTGYTGAINLKAKMDNLEGRTFNTDEKLTVHAEVLADNLDKSVGTAEVIFDEDVKLKFYRMSWQKTNCQSTECESLITDNYNNLFSEDGLSLGNVPKDDDNYYNGNLVVEYQVVKNDGVI